MDKRVTVIEKDKQDRILHTLPMWARDRIKSAEAERDALHHDLEQYVCRDSERLAEVEALRDTLIRLSKWDHLDTAADGPFWKLEIANAIDAARSAK